MGIDYGGGDMSKQKGGAGIAVGAILLLILFVLMMAGLMTVDIDLAGLLAALGIV